MPATVVRASDSIKHIPHRGAYTGWTFNRQINTVAGGVRNWSAPDIALPEHRGVRLSGFEILRWDHEDGSGRGRIAFAQGAFVQADDSGDHRGVIVEEPIGIELVNAAGDTSLVAQGAALWLWAWANDNYRGPNANAQFKVTASSTPPVGHAVCLAKTESGDQDGEFRWVMCGGVSLLDINQRIDGIVAAGGTTRDFYHTALNYHAAHPEYQFMTFQDFNSTDGDFGVWKPFAGDENKFDTDNRRLRQNVGEVWSAPFDSGEFQISPGVYYILASVRCVWLELEGAGGAGSGPPVYDSEIAIVAPDGFEHLVISGEGEYDRDITFGLSLDPVIGVHPGELSIKITPASALTTNFYRMILLGRLVAP